MEYASLGEVVFKIPHYKGHSQSVEYQWTKINTIKAPSSLQWFGTETEEVKISVIWHIDFCNPLKELEKLKKQAEEGLPYKLIIGKIPIGNFVIKSINSNTQKIDAKGTPILITADITLIEFKNKSLKTTKTKTTKTKTRPKAVRKVEGIDRQKFIKTYKKEDK